MNFNLSDFSLIDMLQCGRGVRAAAANAENAQEAAQAIVEYLYKECGHPDAARACALIRFYRTMPFEDLEPRLKVFARRQSNGIGLSNRTKCLTLLATVVQEPRWGDPRHSV